MRLIERIACIRPRPSLRSGTCHPETGRSANNWKGGKAVLGHRTPRYDIPSFEEDSVPFDDDPERPQGRARGDRRRWAGDLRPDDSEGRYAEDPVDPRPQGAGRLRRFDGGC